MPNKYFTRAMTTTEFRKALVAAEITDGDFQKLTGRHRLDVVKMLAGEMPPRHLEAVLLDYLSAHPDRLDDVMDAAEARITGYQKDENRAARRAHLQPKI